MIAGVSSLIGKVWKDERTEEQKWCEAALLRARYAMDQQSDAYHHRIFASAFISVIVIVACALTPPLEFTSRVAAAESVTSAPLPEATPIRFSPAPTIKATPEPIVSIPTPNSTVLPIQEPVATRAPSPVFATVAEAQKAAVERHPDLRVGGSKLNSAFVVRYKFYKQTRPKYFEDSAWPMNLAVEVSQTVHQSKRVMVVKT